jgi:hypothetical protein
MRNKNPRISNEEVISAFSTGVADIKMKEKLSVYDELTSVVRLFEIADRCSRSYDEGGSRGDRRDNDRDEGRRHDGPLCTDPEPLPLPPPTSDHQEENQGAIKSREALPPASWEELKLRYRIATLRNCRGRSR